MRNKMRPIHPGEVLREEFVIPLGLSGSGLAQALHVSPTRVISILKETRPITADTALRLARYFKTTAEFWMNMQMTYDLRVAEREVGADIRREVKRSPPSSRRRSRSSAAA